MRIFAYLGTKGGNRIVMKFCIGVGVPDVISHANLVTIGSGVFEGAGVEFPTFPLTCVVVVDRENRSRGLGCRLSEEPKKLAESLDAHFRIFGGRRG